MTAICPIQRAASHYQGQAALAFVEQLRRVQEAQQDTEPASALCQSSDFEAVHFCLKDELVALWKIGASLDLDMNLIRGAVL